MIENANHMYILFETGCVGWQNPIEQRLQNHRQPNQISKYLRMVMILRNYKKPQTDRRISLGAPMRHKAQFNITGKGLEQN